MKKNICKISLVGLLLSAVVLVWGCGDEKNKVESLQRSDLNSPSNLHALNLSKKIELRWLSQNIEEDFKGFYVFGTSQPWEALRQKIKVPAQVSSSWGGSSSIPICKENNEFFESFGIPASDISCSDQNFLGSLKSKFNSEAQSEALEKNLLQAVSLNCDGHSNGPLSLTDSAQLSNVKQCLVSQIFDPSLGQKREIQNGESMTFFTVSVKGDGLNQISWTSNFVEGAGSLMAFEETIHLKKLNQYRKLHIDLNQFKASLNKEGSLDCPRRGRDRGDNFCAVSNLNLEKIDLPTVYVTGDFTGRQGDGAGRKLRGFISVPATPQGQEPLIAIQSRGAQTQDILNPGVQPRVPASMPLVDQDSYKSDGVVFNLYGNQVFDLKINNPKGGVHFGKIVVDTVSFDSEDPRDFPGVHIKMYLILQSGSNIPHYAF